MTDTKKIKMKVFRYVPGKDAEGQSRYQTYEVDYRDEDVILDGINFIKDHLDATLAFRWSCRMGVCGSCGMMVDGVPKLTCNTFLRDYASKGEVVVEPLLNFPVERDLVVNMDDFMDKLHSVKPWLIRDGVDPLEKNGKITPLSQTPAQLARYKQFSMCINCTLCYAACPVYGRVDDFIGPAALALARRYDQDSRDQAGSERRDVMFSQAGVWECTFVGECSTVCPKNVDPAGAIQQAKVDGAIDYLKRLLLPSGAGKKK